MPSNVRIPPFRWICAVIAVASFKAAKGAYFVFFYLAKKRHGFFCQILKTLFIVIAHCKPSLTLLFSNIIERMSSPPLMRAAASISRRLVATIWMASLATAAALCASLCPLRSMSNSSKSASQSPADVRTVVFTAMAFFAMINPFKFATAKCHGSSPMLCQFGIDVNGGTRCLP